MRWENTSRLQAGDRIVFYSPRTDYPDGEPLQEFTACGVVTGMDVYQVELAPDFHPWRRAVTFVACTPTPIKPLLGQLSSFPTRETGASRSAGVSSRFQPRTLTGSRERWTRGSPSRKGVQPACDLPPP